jgi:hypothetical protein
MRTPLTLSSVLGLTAASMVVTGAGIFLGAGSATAGCAPDPATYWTKSTVSYKSIGSAGGEHNSGSKAITLDYSRKTDTAVSTTVSGGAGFSITAGIAEVKADLSVSVTKSFAKSTTVTGHLSIPAHESGTLQPKAQVTKFTRYYRETTPKCTQDVTNEGSLYGITKVPYFASCVGSDTCTPKP